MAEYLYYFRNRVRKAKTAQRVRLSVIANPADDFEVFNLTSEFAEYARTWTLGGNICFAYSSYPTPPFTHEVCATTTGDTSEGRFCWTGEHHLKLVYTRGGTIQERTSFDRGKTWDGETSRFASGTHPDISVNPVSGMILRSAYDGGILTATRQFPGDASPAAAVTIQDDLGADLLAEDDSFRIIFDRKGWAWLHVRYQGGSETSLWYSTDGGQSFTPQTGAVTGISSGEHPGIGAGHDGMLWAWARVGTALHVTKRYPGATAWSTPAAIVDDAAATLNVADGASSFALAYELPNRLVLATYKSGETTPSEWGSSDRGVSGKRFT